MLPTLVRAGSGRRHKKLSREATHLPLSKFFCCNPLDVWFSGVIFSLILCERENTEPQPFSIEILPSEFLMIVCVLDHVPEGEARVLQREQEFVVIQAGLLSFNSCEVSLEWNLQKMGGEELKRL